MNLNDRSALLARLRRRYEHAVTQEALARQRADASLQLVAERQKDLERSQLRHQELLHQQADTEERLRQQEQWPAGECQSLDDEVNQMNDEMNHRERKP